VNNLGPDEAKRKPVFYFNIRRLPLCTGKNVAFWTEYWQASVIYEYLPDNPLQKGRGRRPFLLVTSTGTSTSVCGYMLGNSNAYAFRVSRQGPITFV
jgi:hypothetical protein